MGKVKDIGYKPLVGVYQVCGDLPQPKKAAFLASILQNRSPASRLGI